MEALMEGPALAPPEGVIPNLDHPQNKNGLALFVFVFCSVISTICVLLRGYGRLWLLKRFQAEDGLIISAFVRLIQVLFVLSLFNNTHAKD
jgi:hypothetical protein